MLIGMTLLGLAIASFPQVAFAQSNPLTGTWKLNLDKSKFSPGVAPRSLTLNIEPDGQNLRLTSQGMDAGGNPRTAVVMHIYDGQPHPSMGTDYDASAYTRVDANTFIIARFKAGKLVAVATGVVSQDGKTVTTTTTGTGDTVGSTIDVAVWDKQ
jgi:hypothetical protein